MSPRPRIALPFRQPFTLEHVREAGLTRAALRGWLERQQVVVLAPGLFAPAHLLQDQRTAQIWRSRAVATGSVAVSARGAALIFGIPLPTAPDASVDRPIALASLPQDCRVRRDGLVLPTPEWTALLLCRGQRLPGALIALDAVARQGSASARLAELGVRLRGRAGFAALQRSLAEINAASESPLESASRGLIIDAGLPVPALQREFAAEGRHMRVDFCWNEAHLIGEADGLGKYTDKAIIADEKARQAILERMGFRVHRWTSKEITTRPEVFVRTLSSLLLPPGARPSPYRYKR